MSAIDESFGCKECGKIFGSKTKLKDHHRVRKTNPIICSYCQNEFKLKCQLKLHMKTHTEEILLACPKCCKKFKRKENLLKHIKVHNEKPFVCQTCSKGFRRRSDFNVHLKVHSGEKPYQCQTCQKLFTHSSSLKNHLLIHFGERQHACPTCDRRFTKKTDMKRHLSMHLNERPHACDVCQKGFIRKIDLVGHMRIHSGEKPFICSVCRKAFIHRSNLNRHIKIHPVETSTASSSQANEHYQLNYMLYDESRLERRGLGTVCNQFSEEGNTPKGSLDVIVKNEIVDEKEPNTSDFNFEIPLIKQEIRSEEVDQHTPSCSYNINIKEEPTDADPTRIDSSLY